MSRVYTKSRYSRFFCVSLVLCVDWKKLFLVRKVLTVVLSDLEVVKLWEVVDVRIQLLLK